MRIISHRSNLYGPDSTKENYVPSIEICLALNFDVEIDLWSSGDSFYLGHDSPVYPIYLSYFFERKEKLWIHCKNQECLSKLIGSDLNYFYHDKDDCTLTSKNFIWTYPGKPLFKNSIHVLPEWNNFEIKKTCHAICTDYPFLIKDRIDKM